MSMLPKLLSVPTLMLVGFCSIFVFLAVLLFAKGTSDHECPLRQGDKILLVNGIEGIVRSPRSASTFGDVDPKRCSYYVDYFDKVGVKHREKIHPGEYKEKATGRP